MAKTSPIGLFSLPDEVVLRIIPKIEYSVNLLSTLSRVSPRLSGLVKSHKSRLLDDIVDTQFQLAKLFAAPVDVITTEYVFRLWGTTMTVDLWMKMLADQAQSQDQMHNHEREDWKELVLIGLYCYNSFSEQFMAHDMATWHKATVATLFEELDTAAILHFTCLKIAKFWLQSFKSAGMCEDATSLQELVLALELLMFTCGPRNILFGVAFAQSDTAFPDYQTPNSHLSLPRLPLPYVVKEHFLHAYEQTNAFLSGSQTFLISKVLAGIAGNLHGIEDLGDVANETVFIPSTILSWRLALEFMPGMYSIVNATLLCHKHRLSVDGEQSTASLREIVESIIEPEDTGGSPKQVLSETDWMGILQEYVSSPALWGWIKKKSFWARSRELGKSVAELRDMIDFLTTFMAENAVDEE